MNTQTRKQHLFLQREAEIVAAAIDLFHCNELDNVTIEQIAKQADIGKGTVYRHFTSKDEIFVRIIIDLNRTMRNEIRNIDSQQPFRDRLDKIIAIIWDHDMRDSQFLRRLNQHLMASNFRKNLKDEILNEFNQLQEEDNAFYLTLLHEAQQMKEIIDEPIESLLFCARAAIDGAILFYWQLESTGEVDTNDSHRYLKAVQNFVYRALTKS